MSLESLMKVLFYFNSLTHVDSKTKFSTDKLTFFKCSFIDFKINIFQKNNEVNNLNFTNYSMKFTTSSSSTNLLH